MPRRVGSATASSTNRSTGNRDTIFFASALRFPARCRINLFLECDVIPPTPTDSTVLITVCRIVFQRFSSVRASSSMPLSFWLTLSTISVIISSGSSCNRDTPVCLNISRIVVAVTPLVIIFSNPPAPAALNASAIPPSIAAARAAYLCMSEVDRPASRPSVTAWLYRVAAKMNGTPNSPSPAVRVAVVSERVALRPALKNHCGKMESSSISLDTTSNADIIRLCSSAISGDNTRYGRLPRSTSA